MYGTLPNERSVRSSPPESESRSSSLPVSLVESIVPVVLSEILDLFVPGTKQGVSFAYEMKKKKKEKKQKEKKRKEKACINTHNTYEILQPANTLYCSTTHAELTLTDP